YFMTGRVIAIRDGQSWRFVNPANPYASGTLRASQEACMAVIADPDEAVLATTPASEPDVSVRRRAARLTLAEDGTIDGDVTFTYTGHLAADLREADRYRNVEEREKSVRDFVVARLPGADVTGVRIEHATDLTLAYQYAFHLRVPGYAQATASRLLLMPALFEQKGPPVFTAADRRHPIHFDYAWT